MDKLNQDNLTGINGSVPEPPQPDPQPVPKPGEPDEPDDD
jgi:hypothetical protein